MEGLVRRAVLPIAQNVLGSVAGLDGDPRVAMSAVLRMLSGKLGDPRTLAIPKLIIREVINFPELAAMYRREVLDRVVPVMVGVLERGMERGYLRRLDAELTVRSVVGPIMAHLVLAEVFEMMPGDGLAMERLVENHLSVLFDGLSVPAGEVK